MQMVSAVPTNTDTNSMNSGSRNTWVDVQLTWIFLAILLVDMDLSSNPHDWHWSLYQPQEISCVATWSLLLLKYLVFRSLLRPLLTFACTVLLDIFVLNEEDLRKPGELLVTQLWPCPQADIVLIWMTVVLPWKTKIIKKSHLIQIAIEELFCYLFWMLFL